MAGATVSNRVKEEVRRAAASLGFARCGFACADPLGCGPLLEAWIEGGRNGHMDYLARSVELRTLPTAVLEGAASIIVVAWPYPAQPPPDPDWGSKLEGRIAAYALGPDYHEHLSAKLESLSDVVRQACAGVSRVHVDSGPLVEKHLARAAGLGWYGHNTNILLLPVGSYFLLGCLLTTARFEPDGTFAGEHCGTCNACGPACPTGALDGQPTIDASRCISYLTIEHRGPIDRELRPMLGNWVFGCDVCQQVCPWNGRTQPAAGGELTPYLPDLLAISHEEFRACYGSSAVARAKRRGLARNAAIALGNSMNVEATAPLENALRSHDEALVRAHAAWALGHLAATAGAAASSTGTAVKSSLHAALKSEPLPPVVAEIDAALANLRQTATD